MPRTGKHDISSAFSGSVRVTSPSVADAGGHTASDPRTRGRVKCNWFPKQQQKKQKSTKTVATKKMSGSGAYDLSKSIKPALKKALQEMGGAAGGALGSRVGMGARGATMGKTIGEKISKMVGSGDYEVSERPVVNSLFPGAGGGGNGYAQFSNAAQSTRIQHREYLQDIQTSGVAGQFSITAYQLNPGLAFTFPYLASIAQNFEEYRVRGMVFEFISTSSPYAANSAMGSVIMAMEYNAAALPFSNKPQMENSDFAISARFDKNMVYGVECSVNSQNTYYVRSSASTLPLTTTDLGTMYVATQPSASYNAAAAINIGELWVSYDIEFYRPRISNSRFGYVHFKGTVAAPGTATMSAIPKAVYGTMTGCVLTQVAGLITLTFPNADIGDSYQIIVGGRVAGAGVFTAALVPGAHPGFVDQAAYAGQTVAAWSTANLAASQYALTTQLVNVAAANPSWSVTLVNSTVGGNDVDIQVIDLGNGFDVTTL